MHLYAFHGGIELPGHKDISTARPIRPCPMPDTLYLPMLQHSGDPCEPCVTVGEMVQAGQRIATANGPRGADLHAPASGRVQAIGRRELAYPPGIEVVCIELAVRDDAAKMPDRLPAMNWREASIESLLRRIGECGVVGLGGAGFPSAEKIRHGRKLLILNGAECEPYISCDDILLRERAGQVIQGGRLLARLTGVERVLLAVEDRMTLAFTAVAGALSASPGEPDDPAFELVPVPTVYPEGGERQLIRVLTGLEVPRNGLPRDIGVLVHNVATAAAVWRAVDAGEPLTHRVVTVTGPGVDSPCNLEVALGTPVSTLIETAGGYTDQAARLLIGGPMMGVALPDDSMPITKTSNCVLVLGADQIRDDAPELPCIRCGDCASVCPARLLPQQLLWHILAGNWQRAEADGVFDCIECGCCDLACPSHIPLVQQYRFAKTEIRHRQREAAAAAAAKVRHEQRQQRLLHDAEQRQRRQAERKTSAASPDAVAAAIARARKSRESGFGIRDSEELPGGED